MEEKEEEEEEEEVPGRDRVEQKGEGKEEAGKNFFPRVGNKKRDASMRGEERERTKLELARKLRVAKEKKKKKSRRKMEEFGYMLTVGGAEHGV